MEASNKHSKQKNHALALTQKEQIFQSEGCSFPGKTYTEVVLEPAYDEAKMHLLDPMMAINKAHLLMLKKQQLISEADAKKIAEAISTIDLQTIRTSCYSGQVEDLFFHVESELLKKAGDIAGNLHIARSRNDMCITMFRLALREKMQTALASVLFLKEQLLQFSKDHVDTLMIGYTHTQQAQPTTLAHYIMAVVDSLNRDIERFKLAYKHCNASPMGAAAFTTTGFNIDREKMQDLLGFSSVVENSYDAIAGADYMAEAMTSTQIIAINLGRFVQDLLLWGTQEYDVLRVADPYVQISSIMPQKRNPVSLEHIRSLLSSCAGNAKTVLTMLHNTPFGDIVDTEDDMQPYAWKSLSLLDKLCRLLGCIIATADINKETLQKRAAASFATITELADTIVRTDQLSFRTAHLIASSIVKDALFHSISPPEITLELVNKNAISIIGKELTLDETTLRQSLDPVYFVNIRTLQGGPNPNEVKRMIDLRRKQQKEQKQWLTEIKNKSDDALYALDESLAKML